MRNLRLFVFLALLGTLLMGCVPAATPAPAVEAPVAKAPVAEEPAAAEGPKAGGSLTVGVPSIVHLDVVGVNQYGLNEVAQLFYETLVDRDVNGEIQPLLIKEISISEDGLTHTWMLQEGVKFHDGTPFNAEAVKWNLDRKINNALSMADSIPWNAIEVVDEYTVQVTLKVAYPGIYNTLHVKTFSMLSPTWAADAGDDALKSEAVGTGPFMVEEYVPNEYLKLVKNPDYWQEGLPYLDDITFRVVPDNNTRATMIEAGDIDVAGFLSFQDLDRFRANDKLTVHAGPSSRHYYIAMNLSNTDKLGDVRVRKAINHAVDREGMAKTIFLGFVSPAHAVIVTPAVDGYADGGYYEYDPEKAKDLLAEAGWTDSNGDGTVDKDGVELVLKLRTRKGTTAGDIETAELVQGFLKEIGVSVDIDIVDTATFLAELNRDLDSAGYPEYDLLNLTWGTFTGNADYVFNSYYSCDAFPPKYWDYSHYCNPDVDAMIAEAAAAPTIEQRNAIYAKIIKQVFDEAPTIPLFDSQSTVASQSYVQGLYLDPAQTIWPTKWAWLDK